MMMIDTFPLEASSFTRSMMSLDSHRGERLVQEQDVGVGPRRSRDGDRLTLAAGELAGFGVHVRHVHVDVVEVLLGELAHRALVEQPHGPEEGELMVEEQVQVHGQLGDEGQVLVHGLDPVRGGVGDGSEMHLVAVDQDASRILGEQPAYDLDEGALAGSVVADQAEHLTAVQRHVDTAQDRERPEGLRQALDLEHRLGVVRAVVVDLGPDRRVAHRLVPSLNSSGCARRDGRATR
jgi:hypothetical protein